MTRRIAYLAGPLFTLAEQEFNRKLANELCPYFNVVLPQEACKGLSKPHLIASRCIADIDSADVVFVNCDGPDMDSGTAWEAGYAFAKGKRIIAYRTDFRRGGDCEDNVNLMIAMTASEVCRVRGSVMALAITLNRLAADRG